MFHDRKKINRKEGQGSFSSPALSELNAVHSGGLETATHTHTNKDNYISKNLTTI